MQFFPFDPYALVEFETEVHIPRVGAMLRIERRDLDGNVVDIEYRRAAPDEDADDPVIPPALDRGPLS